MKQCIFIFILLVFWVSTAFGQFSGGFKAGYNINYMDGPKIVNDSGEELESFNNANGFHVGAILNYEIADYFGLRSYLLFTQRGGNIQFDSEDSYLFLRDVETNERQVSSGSKRISLTVSNSYIEIPLMLYGKYGKFELTFGPSLGILVASTASGSITFDGEYRREPIQFRSIIDHQYYRDDAREGERPIEFNTGLEQVQFPGTHLAYFEFNEKEESLYTVINFGLMGEFNFFFNKGLFLGVGYYYGFNDITNSSMDADWQQLDADNRLVLRDDEDTLAALQLSVGFRF
ncbi:MAG TPA: outer membrane beta-barrel protein [Saprospiraceae bacterium]|nr:outer membrane beta-barrel protein [Saprospiraceae bacterium]